MATDSSTEFNRLLGIMDDLRSKCPWDKKQTIQSLRNLTIEETFELVDSIDDENYTNIKEELGDLLLHIVFYSKIASENNKFTIADVISSLSEKLIFRHPHIYSDTKADTEEEVKANWEKLKLKEGKKSILQGVPKSSPAVIKALRIQDKVSQVGFDWQNKEQVWGKVEEEIGELKTEVDNNNNEKMTDEFGDVLFALINYARFINVDPEQALQQSNKKFIKRFQYIENELSSQDKSFDELNLEEMNDMWNNAKKRT